MYLEVATRPLKLNGLGMDPKHAVAKIEELCRRIIVLKEDSRVPTRLRELVAPYEIRGKQIHDANLVALAVIHGLDVLETANMMDFWRFQTLLPVVNLARCKLPGPALHSLDRDSHKASPRTVL